MKTRREGTRINKKIPTHSTNRHKCHLLEYSHLSTGPTKNTRRDRRRSKKETKKNNGQKSVTKTHQKIQVKIYALCDM